MTSVKIKGIIFDWAGTTVDFGCLAPLAAFQTVFAERGVPVSEDEVRGPMGQLKKDHIRALLALNRVVEEWRKNFGRYPLESDVELLYENFEPALFARLQDYTRPLPQVLETVAELRRRGLKIGSTTGYTRAMIKVVAAGAAELGYAPDFIVCADECRSGRPAPWMIYRNCEALDLMPAAAVVKVGDTRADIQEGRNASVWSVGVCRGSSMMGLDEAAFTALNEPALRRAYADCRQAYLDAGAHFVIDGIEELPGLLTEIESRLARGERPQG